MTNREVENLLRLKEIRTAKGITQTYLSKKLGFKSTSSYKAIEDGRNKLDIFNAKILADTLGVQIEELICEKIRQNGKYEINEVS